MKTFELQGRRSGKSVRMRMELDAAIERGEVVDVCSVTPEGKVHVCRVQHIKARER